MGGSSYTLERVERGQTTPGLGLRGGTICLARTKLSKKLVLLHMHLSKVTYVAA